MLILFSIGPINFDLSALLSFILGVVFGFLLLLLIYLYAVILSMNKNLRLRKADETDIDEEEIKLLIEDAQRLFKDKEQRQAVGYAKLLGNINKELAVDIAKKFYPRSKYPYLELTLDETLQLNHYITDRLEELLEGKIFSLIKGWTLAKLVEINDTKTKIEQNKIVKTARKYGKVTSTALKVMNAVNPVYWIRKYTKETVMNIIMVRIGLALIAITGEETYKIYSKKVFDIDVNLETNVDQIYEELKKDLSEEVEDL